MSATWVPVPATDPFTALAPHFGMLLGVADMDVTVGHTWAKHRLLQAWWNGPVVVHGFRLAVSGVEVQVGPGLGADPDGREVRLAATVCLDLRAWWDRHKDALGGDPTKPFDAHVVALARACLSREVPAPSSGCAGDTPGTAFSRVTETVELLLVPGPSPARPDPCPRVTAFLTGPAPAVGAALPAEGPDRDVGLAWQQVQSSGDPRSATVDQLRRLAALDSLDRTPPGRLFPLAEPDPDEVSGEPDLAHGLVLGDLHGLKLPAIGTADPVTVEAIDHSTRDTHLPTGLLSRLIGAGPAAPIDGGGPRLIAGSVSATRTAGANAGDPDVVTLTATLTATVLAGSLTGAVGVGQLDTTSGWTPVAATATVADTALTVTLAAPPPAGMPLRLRLTGTGDRPIVGVIPAGGAPASFAGLLGGSPVTAGQGADAVVLLPGGAA